MILTSHIAILSVTIAIVTLTVYSVLLSLLPISFVHSLTLTIILCVVCHSSGIKE